MNHMVIEVNLSTLITVYPEYYVEINWQVGYQNMLLEILPKTLNDIHQSFGFTSDDSFKINFPSKIGFQ